MKNVLAMEAMQFIQVSYIIHAIRKSEDSELRIK